MPKELAVEQCALTQQAIERNNQSDQDAEADILLLSAQIGQGNFSSCIIEPRQGSAALERTNQIRSSFQAHAKD